MKTLVLLIALIGSYAFAYNSKYSPVKLGELAQIEVSSKNEANTKIISLLVDINSTSDRYPIVEIAKLDQKNCFHKQTLILFSGFDMAKQSYKRTYEIQIEREALKSCYLIISASVSYQDRMKAARVSIVSK